MVSVLNGNYKCIIVFKFPYLNKKKTLKLISKSFFYCINRNYLFHSLLKNEKPGTLYSLV